MKELTNEAFLKQVNDKVAQERARAIAAEEKFRAEHDTELHRYYMEYHIKRGCGCPWCPKRPSKVEVQAEDVVARALRRGCCDCYD